MKFIHSGSGSASEPPAGFFSEPCWMCNESVTPEQQIVRFRLQHDAESGEKRLTFHKECARAFANHVLQEVAAYDEDGG